MESIALWEGFNEGTRELTEECACIQDARENRGGPSRVGLYLDVESIEDARSWRLDYEGN